MNIKFPSFKNTECVNLTVCGELKLDKSKKISLLKTTKTMISSYRANNKKAYIRVIAERENSNYYLQIDSALSEFFGKGNTPKTIHNINEVRSFLKKYLGYAIYVFIDATFKTAINNLPSKGLIRTLNAGTKEGNIGVKLTAGTFAISGAPIFKIVWNTYKENKIKNISIRVIAEKSDIIDELYLIRLFK